MAKRERKSTAWRTLENENGERKRKSKVNTENVFYYCIEKCLQSYI